MTVQVRDKYTYKGKDYNFLSSPCFDGFNPYSYGFLPIFANTTCITDGYWCEYIITNEGLSLDTLYIQCEDGNYPKLFNRTYKKNIFGQPVHRMGYRIYKHLNMNAHISGSIFLGKDMIENQQEDDERTICVYDTVKEFIFHNDKLIRVIDWSSTVEELRQNKKDPEKIAEYKAKYMWL